jgi:ComF family protein
MASQYIETMRPAALFDALAAPLRRLPSQCAVCRGWARQRLCETCALRYAAPRPRCQRCAIAVPEGVIVCGASLAHAPLFDGTIAAVDYEYPWDDLVRRFKFDASLDLAGVLAQCLLDAVRRSEAPRPDWLLPVPLATERLRERGNNQAWELARRVASGLPCATDARLLLRMKDTPHQLTLPPGRRAANVRGAFALEPRRRHELQGRSVAVLDDVMTTGATLSEITVTLLQAGARSVQVWVLARTPRKTDA